ncbi:MAG: hypothetical protein ACM3PY_14385 [Omnitrophica WOR_2 bacterium]
MLKNRRLWILLGAIVVLSAAFLFLNFHAAVSNTQSTNNSITTGIGEGMPYAMQRRDKISIALVEEGPLASALQKALAEKMNYAGMGDIEAVQGLKPVYPNPVLVVKVSEPGLLWTPLFATGRFAIQAGYSSGGDTTFMGETPGTIDNKNGPALMMHTEYKVSDRSWGLISRPGYHQILADYLAQQIVASLKDLYKIS